MVPLIMVTAKTLNGPNPQYRDPRHRFEMGKIHVGQDLHARLSLAYNQEAEARFAAGGMLHKHLCGDWGDVSKADAAINEHVLKQHAGGGSLHCVISAFDIGAIRIEIVTNLGQRKTTMRVVDRAVKHSKLA